VELQPASEPPVPQRAPASAASEQDSARSVPVSTIRVLVRPRAIELGPEGRARAHWQGAGAESHFK
jgi:hypothetical protein